MTGAEVELRLRLLPGVVAVGVEQARQGPIHVVSVTTGDAVDAVRRQIAPDADFRVEVVVLPETAAAALARQLLRLDGVHDATVHEDDHGAPSVVDVGLALDAVAERVRRLVAEMAGPACAVRFELSFEFELPRRESR